MVRKRVVKGYKFVPIIGTFDFYIDRLNNVVHIKTKKGREFIMTIKREETSLAKFIKHLFGVGDYTLTMTKAKITGFRRFWNGVIMEDKYIRYPSDKDIGFMDSMLSKYIKPNPPNKFYSL